MTDLSTLRFFRTPAHSCSYLEDRQASTLFVDPQAQLSPELYSELSLLGFRRSGDYLYRPHCDSCNACIPARVRVDDFRPRRRHRRILKNNVDLVVNREPARFSRELYTFMPPTSTIAMAMATCTRLRRNSSPIFLPANGPTPISTGFA